jgi:hypothetical protein
LPAAPAAAAAAAAAMFALLPVRELLLLSDMLEAEGTGLTVGCRGGGDTRGRQSHHVGNVRISSLAALRLKMNAEGTGLTADAWGG